MHVCKSRIAPLQNYLLSDASTVTGLQPNSCDTELLSYCPKMYAVSR